MSNHNSFPEIIKYIESLEIQNQNRNSLFSFYTHILRTLRIYLSLSFWRSCKLEQHRIYVTTQDSNAI